MKQARDYIDYLEVLIPMMKRIIREEQAEIP